RRWQRTSSRFRPWVQGTGAPNFYSAPASDRTHGHASSRRVRVTTVQESLVAPAPAAALRWAVRTPLRAREITLLALGGIALAVVMTWPVAAHLGSRVAGDLGDPIRTAWQVAWEGHALTLSSGGLWDTNAFWPLATSLAFSDSLLGYAPAGLIGSGGVTAAV